MGTSVPNLATLAQDFLECTYAEGECWKFVLDLLRAGGRISAAADPAEVLQRAREVWWHDDPRDPWTLVKPWDWAMLRRYGKPVGHIGIFLDVTQIIHLTEKGTVCLQRTKVLGPRLLQIARLPERA